MLCSRALDLGVVGEAVLFLFVRCVCLCVCVGVPAESSCLLWRLRPICQPPPLTRSHRLPWRPSTFANSECLWMENGSACESWMTSHLRPTQSLPTKVWSDPVLSRLSRNLIVVAGLGGSGIGRKNPCIQTLNNPGNLSSLPTTQSPSSTSLGTEYFSLPRWGILSKHAGAYLEFFVFKPLKRTFEVTYHIWP